VNTKQSVETSNEARIDGFEPVLDLRAGRPIELVLDTASSHVGFAGPVRPVVATQIFRSTIEVAIAAILIVLLAPVLALLALMVWLTSRGSAFFAHPRLARGGRLDVYETFDCLKFRTMYVDADERLEHLLASDDAFLAQWTAHHKVTDDPRITPVGKWLRRWSLDELPQLFNIVGGDMCFVGPRPVTTYEVQTFGPALPTVLSVHPGLTGLWQVSGRSERTLEERIQLDVDYVIGRNVLLDARIMARTFGAVVGGAGAC
jgi:exopolysaccharide production protein ExoY